jgi:hypothetical protein
MNSDNESEGIRMQNYHDDIHGENDIQEPTAFKIYTKPVTATENNQRRRVEKPPTPPRVPLVRKS